MLKTNRLKKILKEGGKPIGTYIKSTDSSIIEICSMVGFDFVIMDCEHTSFSKERMSALLMAAETNDVTALIRVRENNQPLILQALDAGAYGVQIPNIRTADEVKQAVQSIYYMPKGGRGFANTTRAGGYGLMQVKDYIAKTYDELMCICYCETREAYENLDEILTVDGLDMIFIGPSDLSQAYSHIGEVEHPEVLAIVDDIIQKAKKAGKWVGTVAGNGKKAAELYKKGVDMVVLSSDHGMLASGTKAMLNELKEEMN